MRRRDFIMGIAGSAAAWPLAARAQQPAKVTYRVALILTTSPISEMAGSEPIHPPTKAFLHGLRAAGYVEGQNLSFERRSAEGKFEQFSKILTELISQPIDVIMTVGDEMAREAKRVAGAVPIVMATSNDPVGVGVVASSCAAWGEYYRLPWRCWFRDRC